MIQLPQSLQTIKESFEKFPGIGKKSAMRFTMELADWTSEERQALSQSLNNLSLLKKCQECFVFSDTDLCEICSNPSRRKQKSICIVETMSDLMAIEQSEQHRGLYHILGGVLNPLRNIGPQDLAINFLVKRVDETEINNIILAINPSVEGDATCSYIKDQMNTHVVIERIGFGLPMGGSLEYVDTMTISIALENRRSF